MPHYGNSAKPMLLTDPGVLLSAFYTFKTPGECLLFLKKQAAPIGGVLFADAALSNTDLQNEFRFLRELADWCYAENIPFFKGILQDADAKRFEGQFDYRVACFHQISKDGASYRFGKSIEDLGRFVQVQYDGDLSAFLREYYQKAAELPTLTDCDAIPIEQLIPHFLPPQVFAEQEIRCRRLCVDALDVLLSKDIRIILTTKYLDGKSAAHSLLPILLRRIGECRGRAVLASGATQPSEVFAGFDRGIAMLHSAGIGAVEEYTSAGWRIRSI